MTDATHTSERLLRVRDVIARVGISRSAIYARMASGEFPAPRRIGVRAIAWRESDIAAWIASRPVAGAAAPERERDARFAGPSAAGRR